VLSFSFSLFSLGINFNLINIDNFVLWGKDESKSITDYSVISNSSFDVYLKNLIDSNPIITYSKVNQILGNDFTKKIGSTNNKKSRTTSQ